jgi:hypothetical protein
MENKHIFMGKHMAFFNHYVLVWGDEFESNNGLIENEIKRQIYIQN